MFTRDRSDRGTRAAPRWAPVPTFQSSQRMDAVHPRAERPSCEADPQGRDLGTFPNSFLEKGEMPAETTGLRGLVCFFLGGFCASQGWAPSFHSAQIAGLSTVQTTHLIFLRISSSFQLKSRKSSSKQSSFFDEKGSSTFPGLIPETNT